MHIDGQIPVAKIFRLLLLLLMLYRVQHITINDSYYWNAHRILNSTGLKLLPTVPVHHCARIISEVIVLVSELLRNTYAAFSIPGVLLVAAT